MSAPSEYEAPSVIHRDAYACMFDGWSPSELHGLDVGVDLLRPAHDPITVPGKSRLLIRSSMCAMPFDVLHSYWDPHATPPVDRRGDALASRCLQLIVHEIPNGPNDANGSAIKRMGSKAVGHLDPFQQLFLLDGVGGKGQSSSTSASLSQSVSDPSWYRVVADCGNGRRRFVVERSNQHILALLQALRYSYPQLAVPFISEVTACTLNVVLAFVSVHGDALQTYVPLQYFLFEQNYRLFSTVFNGLSDAVRQRHQQEERAFAQARRPLRSSWFGFGSSKDSSPTSSTTSAPSDDIDSGLHSLRDEVDYAERDERIGKHLPSKFRSTYYHATTWNQCLSDALQNAHHLERCLVDEGDALESLAQAFTELQASLSDDFIPSLSSPSVQAPAATSQSPASSSSSPSLISVVAHTSATPTTVPVTTACTLLTVRETNKVLKYMTTVASVLQTQVAIPMATSLKNAVGEAEVYAMSRRQFLRSMIHLAKFVQDKEALVLGKEDIRDSPAASNPLIMAVIKDVYAKRRSTLRSQKAHLSDEMIRMDKSSQAALARVCTIAASLYHHIADAYDARHYTGVDATVGRPTAEPSSPRSPPGAPHPILAILKRTTDELGTS